MIQLNTTQWQKESYTFDIASVANNLIEEIDETVKMNKFIRNALDILHLKAELANLTSILEDANLMDIDTFIPLKIQQVKEKYNKQHPGIKGKIDWHSIIQKLCASEGIAIELSEKLIVKAYKYLTNLVLLLERISSCIISKTCTK